LKGSKVEISAQPKGEGKRARKYIKGTLFTKWENSLNYLAMFLMTSHTMLQRKSSISRAWDIMLSGKRHQKKTLKPNRTPSMGKKMK
jgi:hypothetical protein